MYLFIYLFTKKMFVIILAKQSYFSFETKKEKVIFEKNRQKLYLKISTLKHTTETIKDRSHFFSFVETNIRKTRKK